MEINHHSNDTFSNSQSNSKSISTSHSELSFSDTFDLVEKSKKKIRTLKDKLQKT